MNECMRVCMYAMGCLKAINGVSVGWVDSVNTHFFVLYNIQCTRSVRVHDVRKL